MALEISSTLVDRLLNEAGNSPDCEVCGLLFGTPDHILEASHCRNVAADPHDAFEIDPSQLIAAHRAERRDGPGIVGCYHSHPAGPSWPSPRDAAAANPDGSIWIILSGRDVGCYRAVENGSIEGRFDPVCLVVVDR